VFIRDSAFIGDPTCIRTLALSPHHLLQLYYRVYVYVDFTLHVNALLYLLGWLKKTRDYLSALKPLSVPLIYLFLVLTCRPYMCCQIITTRVQRIRDLAFIRRFTV